MQKPQADIIRQMDADTQANELAMRSLANKGTNTGVKHMFKYCAHADLDFTQIGRSTTIRTPATPWTTARGFPSLFLHALREAVDPIMGSA